MLNITSLPCWGEPSATFFDEAFDQFERHIFLEACEKELTRRVRIENLGDGAVPAFPDHIHFEKHAVAIDVAAERETVLLSAKLQRNSR